MKLFFRLLLRLLYRFEVHDPSVLDTTGPVLLIPNHVSWLDWLFLYCCLPPDWKFVTSSTTAQTSWVHRMIMVNRSTFPIDTASPYAVKRMAEYLQQGGRLVLFAEGRLSLTGSLMKLFDGTGFLLFKTKAHVITCYLRGANRLPWVRHSGWTQWFPHVSAHFSDLLVSPHLKDVSTTVARKRLTDWLLDQMIRGQFETEMKYGPPTPLAAIAETASKRPKTIVLEDITHQEVTYRRLMTGARVLAAAWARRLPQTDNDRVGLLLPNINATPVVILSLWAAGKVPAILNFSTGSAMMLTCAQLAGLKYIVTSRAFLERSKLKADVFEKAGIQLLFLEEIRSSISPSQKLSSLLRQMFAPLSGLPKLNPNNPAVVLFTSGSEGVPKGVELTHGNLIANIRQMLSVIDLEDRDRVFNALPLFHSFGLTVGTLLSLVRGLYIFLYPSPLHYRMVPAAIYDRACTVVLGTNTFLNGYARKAHPYDFRSVRYLFAAAEKLQDTTAATWAQRFGIRILEAYGATECSPALTINTALRPKYGSVGRFMPDIEYKLESVESVAEGGRLFVRGPNIMHGYLNADANVKYQSLQGWYDTGDIARVDDEGFVFLLGRLKRFAKVSGEMVSLTAVENALAGAFPEYGLRFQIAILSRPDPEKGEALIAVTNEPRLQLDQIRAAIKSAGLSNLCVPREIKIAREIPKLGTGKINYRELEKLL